MTELRENARCIFWSGALAFHGPKIIFLHDKHEEFLVEKSSFILCTFVYPRCYGRLKYGKIQRTNGIQNMVYFRRVVTNERKFGWRWNIVGKLFQGMKNNLWKNESKTIFCCLERALWKCTEGMIEICKLGRFWPISNFRILAKIKTCWNFWILFLKRVHQKGLGAKKKSWSFASVAGFLKITDNLS